MISLMLEIANITSLDSIQIPYLSAVFKALGGIAAAYLIYFIINTILNIRKNREIVKIRELLEKIDKKIK
jgi:hypothetical protein